MFRDSRYLAAAMVLGIGLASAPAWAQVIVVQDSGGANPNTLGFTGAFGGAAPGSASGGAWNISGGPWNTNYAQYILPASAISSLNTALTWTFTATFGNLSTNTSPTYPGAPNSCGSYAAVSFGGYRFDLGICSDGSGDQILSVDPFTGSPTYTIAGLGTKPVTLSLIYTNSTRNADVYVNGVDVIHSFAGGNQNTGEFVIFGGENRSFTNVELSYATASPTPTISLVANAESQSATIAPNTWVEIKGSNLLPPAIRASGKAPI